MTNVRGRFGSRCRSTTTCAVWCILFTLSISLIAVFAEGDDQEEHYRERRAAAKPWLMKEFELFQFPDNIYLQLVEILESQLGVSNATDYLPRRAYTSPFTIIFLTLVIVNAWSWISYHLSGSWVEASHILVKDTSPKTLKGLISLQVYIGTNAKNFGVSAKQYSQCPSNEQNGDLGRFGPGTMAPPFDKICFDPATPLNTCVGPVQTQFGYHLIYIRKRKF